MRPDPENLKNSLRVYALMGEDTIRACPTLEAAKELWSARAKVVEATGHNMLEHRVWAAVHGEDR
jgi:hypothetical protein